MAHHHHNNRHDHSVIDVVKPSTFIGGLEFSGLTYTVAKKQRVDGKWTSRDVDLLHRITGYAPKGCVTAVMGPSGAGKSTFLDGLAGRIASGSLEGRVALDGAEMSPTLVKRTSAYVMQDDRLFPMLTVYETLMFAADFRLGAVPREDKRLRVEKLIEQLGLTSSQNTYIGDEGTRGVSGGERRRVSIGVDIIHGPSLLFLDEPTSGLDSTSAHGVVEKVHDIARAGSTVILTIHQPSHRILSLIDHLIILARGQLMFIGSPKDVTRHLARMGRKVPKGENSIEYLLDVVREYDQSELGVEALAEFCLTGMKPPKIDGGEYSISTVFPQTPQSFVHHRMDDGFDRSIRSPLKSPWGGTVSVTRTLRLTPSTHRSNLAPPQSPPSVLSGYYTRSIEIVPGTPTPYSSDISTVHSSDYRTTPTAAASSSHLRPPRLGPKFVNPYPTEVWVLMRRNFINIRRTPELFLSRQMVLTFMGVMMATMFINPKANAQGINNRMSFFIFTVSLFFFSSNDAVPAFIQERFIFVRETSHNAYRASSYAISGIITYLPFLAVQALTYAAIVWKALRLDGEFHYFVVVLYTSLLSTNSFVVFVSSVVPNFILGYAAVIAFTALFFLFCGYFLSSRDIPSAWKWMNYVSTMKYPYEGLVMNQFQTDKVFETERNLTGFDILEQLGIEESRKWRMVLALLGWAVFYRVLFYLVLRFASKIQRT
ncbi:ABC transporter G family member 6 [Acorus calamus]|uniref:ABC transporter G family member STR2 n=1 Tax=Acorus calamus TaxID=4465 RepID=A0AAV9CWW0_ACOCL|nr:ABC transporter G family member 6 [Acorus calamus]